MICDIITLFPEMFSSITEYGVFGRAVNNKILQLNFWNPRDFTTDSYQTVDDRPYGGGPGMVMKVQPLQEAIFKAKASNANESNIGNNSFSKSISNTKEGKSNCISKSSKVILMSPQGKLVTQNRLLNLLNSNIRPIFVAGRYEGIDERFVETYVDEQWSIGDYVLSGGELAIMVVLDALARLLPGVLGNNGSALHDSFMSGLLDHPHYTRPKEINGKCVPDVLLDGNHVNIKRWRQKQQLGRTWLYRKDLLQKINLTDFQEELLKEFIYEMGEKS